MTHLAPVVVGIDGGNASVAALEFAVREAQLRETHVRALTCWPTLDRSDDTSPLRCASYEQAAAILEETIAEVKQRHPHSVRIVLEVERSLAGPALVTASADAQLLVLGSTTRGSYGHRHGRKTIEHCLLFAHSPVVVVPWTAAGLDQTDIDIDLHHAPLA